MLPPEGSVLRKLPLWLKIGIPLTILLLGLMVLAFIQVAREEIPEHAQVPAIQARFLPQLAFLQEMSESLPLKQCGGDSGLDTIALLEPWWEDVRGGEHLLADPVVLGAEVMRYCEDGREIAYVVKNYQGPEGAWSPSIFFPGAEYPSVSLWRRGSRRLIRYEDRQPGSSGNLNGIRLTVDLQALHPEAASAEPLPGGEPSH